jgi:hypothetical protein
LDGQRLDRGVGGDVMFGEAGWVSKGEIEVWRGRKRVVCLDSKKLTLYSC